MGVEKSGRRLKGPCIEKGGSPAPGGVEAGSRKKGRRKGRKKGRPGECEGERKKESG